VTIQKPMEKKILLGFWKGNLCDANFWVGLQKYIISTPLYSVGKLKGTLM